MTSLGQPVSYGKRVGTGRILISWTRFPRPSEVVMGSKKLSIGAGQAESL